MGEGPSNAKKNELLELDDPSHHPHATGRAGSEPADAEGVASGIGPVPMPTIIPKFDPSQYAEESEIRERMPTLTDEAALEQARLQSSMPSNPPPPRRPLSYAPGGPVTVAPPAVNPRDSSVEIDADEADIDSFDPSVQVAILTERLSPLSRIPSLAKAIQLLGPLLEDPKTAYVLGFVDGILPLETIIDVTGLPEVETLRVLDRMISASIVVFHSR